MVSIEQQLCLSIEKCDSTEVQRLIKSGVNVNTLAEGGISPMHWACGVVGDEAARMEIVKLLVSSGGDPNIKSTDGATPMHVAASWGYLDILKFLIENGGDPWLEDLEGCNAWDSAVQENHLCILKYLASYMEDDHVEPAEDSVQCNFVKCHRVDISNSSLSWNSLEFLGSDSLLLNNTAVDGVDSSNNFLNMAVCDSPEVTNNSSNSSFSIVAENKYTDAEKGIELLELHFPSRVKEESVTDASQNEALCSSDGTNSVNWRGDSMDSQLLYDELRALGCSPGPITATTKPTYLRLYFRLRREKAKAAHEDVPKPKRFGLSEELEAMLLNYPGLEEDTKLATLLNQWVVTHFTCPDPLTPLREGLTKTSFNYLLLDPRITKNLPLNETQDQEQLFKRFVDSIFYIGKGKQTRPHEHLYEAIKLRSRSQEFLKVSKKVKTILEIWEGGHGIISIHVFQNSVPVEAFCREAAMIEAVGLSNITNVLNGQYYGVCKSWSDSLKKRWGCLLLHKAFHIFLHEGERQIRPANL